jgi:hypothetical protein
MSFIGAVAASVRQALSVYAAEIKTPVLLIGAGNFTVASVLRSGGFAGRIKACDISLYTSALGAFLSGNPFEISESPDCPEQLRGLLHTETILDTVASIALLYDLREVWQVKNPYQERTVKQYRNIWEELLAATKEKLQAFAEHVVPIEYQACDGLDFMAAHDRSHTVFAFPPTYKAGYEKLEKLLHAALQWTPPPYREMTDKSMELYELVAEFNSYFVVLEKDLPEVHAILGQPSAVLPRGRAGFSHIIAKKTKTKIVLKKTIKSRDIGPIWPPDREITGKESLALARIALGQSIRLNELFLSARIDYFSGGVGVSLAFLLDGHVFGKVDFCPSAHQWKLPDDRPMIYIMSDLAVPSCEKRLAKLVLLCIQSREVKEILDLRYMENFAWACTTAFSKHPASMKYRGIFKLHKRKEVEAGFMLNYFAPFQEHGIGQVLEIWRKKYKK